MPPALSDDRTTRARIRDAAIGCFGRDGVATTTVRAVAAAAGVSPASVIHHFGSMEELRRACDQHVAATIRERKSKAMAAGTGLDPLAALREADEDPPVLRYLARTLADGSPEVAALLDEMVADATKYMQEGVDSGILVPTDHPRERAAVLTLWSLGALVLHDHVQRLLGADLMGSPDALATTGAAYFRGATDILANGLLSTAMAQRLADAFDRQDTPDNQDTPTNSEDPA